ncbi:MAG: TOBE domain-containing protein [Alphaproteobacteria bacterium]|nr:TOBE domain-containing protein [Alphaproteobacteria bacterium]
MTEDRIDAYLVLRSGGRLLAGRDRIHLLEAVIEHGSITKAAKAVDASYKTAWDAVDAINNLLPTPAFITRVGGRAGGSVEVTEAGRRLIATFHHIEDRLTRLSSLIAEEGLEDIDDTLFWATSLKISARNIFRTEVMAIRRWPVDVEVSLKVSETSTIHAVVTNAAADDLDLKPDHRVLALIKAPFVHLLRPNQAAGVRRNLFRGPVKRRVDAEVNSEIHLDIGDGKTMVAVIPRLEAEDLGIAKGLEIAATFDANHVILAV